MMTTLYFTSLSSPPGNPQQACQAQPKLGKALGNRVKDRLWRRRVCTQYLAHGLQTCRVLQGKAHLCRSASCDQEGETKGDQPSEALSDVHYEGWLCSNPNCIAASSTSILMSLSVLNLTKINNLSNVTNKRNIEKGAMFILKKLRLYLVCLSLFLQLYLHFYPT